MPYEPRTLWLQAFMVLTNALMRGILAPDRIRAAFALAFAKAGQDSYKPPFFPARSAMADPLTHGEGFLNAPPAPAKNSSLIAPEQEKHCA
jgi:hypothetical protein